MTRALVLVVARLEVTAVIRSKEHYRVVIQLQTLERVVQAAIGFIEPLDHPVIAAQVLMSRAGQGR